MVQAFTQVILDDEKQVLPLAFIYFVLYSAGFTKQIRYRLVRLFLASLAKANRNSTTNAFDHIYEFVMWLSGQSF